LNVKLNVKWEHRQSRAQLHMRHRLTRYIIIATIYKPSHRVKQIAQLSQRDRATHELLRFAKLQSEFLSHPLGA